MGLLTTCIGAYPKPDYVNLPDWFEDLDTPDPLPVGPKPWMQWERKPLKFSIEEPGRWFWIR